MPAVDPGRDAKAHTPLTVQGSIGLPANTMLCGLGRQLHYMYDKMHTRYTYLYDIGTCSSRVMSLSSFSRATLRESGLLLMSKLMELDEFLRNAAAAVMLRGAAVLTPPGSPGRVFVNVDLPPGI